MEKATWSFSENVQTSEQECVRVRACVSEWKKMKYKYLTLNFTTLKPSNEFLPRRTMQPLVHVL